MKSKEAQAPRPARTGGAPPASAPAEPKATVPPSVGSMLSAGFALMALVPILLSLFLLDRGEGSVVGLPGLIVLCMLASALAGFHLIRRELGALLVSAVRTASREATSGLENRLREASEDEIGKISTTIRSITTQLQEQRPVPTGRRGADRLEDGIARVAHAVQAANGVDQLRSLLVEGALACVEGRTAYLVGVDEESGDFVTQAATGEEAEVASRWRIPLGEGLPGRCARERRALLLADAALEGLAPPFASPSRAAIAAPVLSGETLHGVLVVHESPQARLSEEDAAALGGYAAVAATALGAWTARDRLEHAIDESLAGLVAAIEARDPYARGHAARVARYCDEMAKVLRFDADTRSTLRRAALLHDVGKIGLPESLLRKEERFTPEELELVRTHAVAGEKLLRAIPAMASLAPLVRHHHERCDGSGYPDGLKGDAIPLPTHVLIVADAFDDLTSDRAYRKATSLNEALEAMRVKAGTWYDRRAVHALVGLDPKLLSATDDTSGRGAGVRGRATASVSVKS